MGDVAYGRQACVSWVVGSAGTGKALELGEAPLAVELGGRSWCRWKALVGEIPEIVVERSKEKTRKEFSREGENPSTAESKPASR